MKITIHHKKKYKMKVIYLVLLTLFSIHSFSQKNDFEVLSSEKVVGKNLFTSSEIKGVEYIFPNRIHEIYLDTTSGFLTVQLRKLSKNGKWLNNKGHILLYDLNEKKLKWSKKIAYQLNSLKQFNNTMILTSSNNSYYLDINTGNKLWKVKNNIYHVDPFYNIGMGYKYKSLTGYSNELEGINLTNGKAIWKKTLNKEYGWNDIFYINDSTLLVVAAGLHLINIKNGVGWDYNTITGKKDYSATIATNVAGAALGVLTGTFVTSTGHNLVYDVVSNVIIDSLNIYFSSAEQLAKINKKSGEIIWKHPFPKKTASKSIIFEDDKLIYMINKGYAFMRYRQLNFGKPFIAAFEKETGKQKYLSLINTKDNPILQFKVVDKEIYLVFKNRIAKYSQKTGNLINEKTFLSEKFGELKFFLGNQVFITNKNEEFISLTQSDTTKIYVFTSKREVLIIDNQLNVKKSIDYKDLNSYYLKVENYKFIAKDNLTWIIDNEGKKIAELNMSSNSFLIGNTLCQKQNDSFIMVDLTDIIKH